MDTGHTGLANYDSLIERIYEAALDPQQWRDALTGVAQYLGCPLVSLVPTYNAAGGHFSTGFEDGAKPYAEYWWEKDCITTTVAQKNSVGLVCDWDLLSWERIKTDPFYQEFRRDHGVGHCCAFVGEVESGGLLGMGAHFDLGHMPSNKNLEMISVIGKHVTRAAAVQERAAAGLARAQIDELLSVIDCAAALVDDAGRVLHRNAAMRLCEGDGIQIVNGRLTCSVGQDQVALDRMIRTVRQATQGVEPSLALVARPSGRRPFLARAIPLSASRFEIAGLVTRRQALVLFVDLESVHLKRPDAALKRLGLSPTEARIAALVGAGYSLRYAAIQQGVAEETI